VDPGWLALSQRGSLETVRDVVVGVVGVVGEAGDVLVFGNAAQPESSFC
jgi:hypothetical protein